MNDILPKKYKHYTEKECRFKQINKKYVGLYIDNDLICILNAKDLYIAVKEMINEK